MELRSRKLLDRSFSGLGIFSIILLAFSLLVILGPIFVRGCRAFVFKATVEHRRLMLEKFGRGNRGKIEAEVAEAKRARQPVYDMIANFEKGLKSLEFAERQKYGGPLREVKDLLCELLGPFPGQPRPVLVRNQYGQTRWDRAQAKVHHVLHIEQYDYSDPTKMGRKFLVERADDFKGTALEPLFGHIEKKLTNMLRPQLTIYWRFLFDKSLDAHFFGGVWPEMLGTF